MLAIGRAWILAAACALLSVTGAACAEEDETKTNTGSAVTPDGDAGGDDDGGDGDGGSDAVGGQ